MFAHTTLSSIRNLTAAAILTTILIGSTVQAEEPTARVAPNANPSVRVAPWVNPNPVVAPAPKLGFQGQMINGYGMRVNWVNPGSPAQRAGLEGGDVILQVNGRRITTLWDYEQSLRQAAATGGYVSMRVRNVRFDLGQPVPEFMTVHTQLNTTGPFPAYGVGPVAARSATN